MSDVQFNEDPDVAVRRVKEKKTGSISAWIIRSKLAKDQKQANQVLLAILVTCIVLAIIVYVVTQPHTASSAVPALINSNPGSPAA